MFTKPVTFNVEAEISSGETVELRVHPQTLFRLDKLRIEEDVAPHFRVKVSFVVAKDCVAADPNEYPRVDHEELPATHYATRERFKTVVPIQEIILAVRNTSAEHLRFCAVLDGVFAL